MHIEWVSSVEKYITKKPVYNVYMVQRKWKVLLIYFVSPLRTVVLLYEMRWQADFRSIRTTQSNIYVSRHIRKINNLLVSHHTVWGQECAFLGWRVWWLFVILFDDKKTIISIIIIWFSFVCIPYKCYYWTSIHNLLHYYNIHHHCYLHLVHIIL